MRYRMSPRQCVSLKWRTISGVIFVPGMPNTRQEPTSSSRVISLIIQKKRSPLPVEAIQFGAPGGFEAADGPTGFQSAANRIGTAQNIERELLIFILVGRGSPGKLRG